MTTTTLKFDNDDFWRQVKAKAAREGVPLRRLILRLLAEWLRT